MGRDQKKLLAWRRANYRKNRERRRAEMRERYHSNGQFVTPEELEACREDPRKARTIRGDDFIVCLECGELLEKLTRPHLKIHGMTAAEYKAQPGPDGVTRRYNKNASLSSISAQRKHARIAKEQHLGQMGRRHILHGEEIIATRGKRDMSLQYRLEQGDRKRGKALPDLWKKTAGGHTITDFEIARLCLRGKKTAEIAQHLGLSDKPIQMRRRRMGFPAGRPCLFEHGKPLTGQDALNLCTDYDKTKKEIAERLDVSQQWMSTIARNPDRPLTVELGNRVLKADRNLLETFRVKRTIGESGRPKHLPTSKENKLPERYGDLLSDLQALRDWIRTHDTRPKWDRIWEWLCQQSRAGQLRALLFWPQFFAWIEKNQDGVPFFNDGELSSDIPSDIAIEFLAKSFDVSESLAKSKIRVPKRPSS